MSLRGVGASALTSLIRLQYLNSVSQGSKLAVSFKSLISSRRLRDNLSMYSRFLQDCGNHLRYGHVEGGLGPKQSPMLAKYIVLYWDLLPSLSPFCFPATATPSVPAASFQPLPENVQLPPLSALTCNLLPSLRIPRSIQHLPDNPSTILCRCIKFPQDHPFDWFPSARCPKLSPESALRPFGDSVDRLIKQLLQHPRGNITFPAIILVWLHLSPCP